LKLPSLRAIRNSGSRQLLLPILILNQLSMEMDFGVSISLGRPGQNQEVVAD